jgi:hypothetical protein
MEWMSGSADVQSDNATEPYLVGAAALEQAELAGHVEGEAPAAADLRHRLA